MNNFDKSNYRLNATYDGFKLVAAEEVKSLSATAFTFEHLSSGARIIHISNDDSENCFCISIPTIPEDDTGMPHILEHSTLAGSKKFPCREPFFEMIKRSMATFINALTGSDMTYYPVSSCVPKDLFNLADVYFDGVFHPLLTRETFMREAHHLEPADPQNPLGDLKIDGIVYSEMKGVYSDPEGILESDLTKFLLPDTCHGRDYGGDPEAIPDLTLDKLREFHQTRYNPSNAFIILYGNIPTSDYLNFLSPRLAPFAKTAPIPLPTRQPHWNAPRSFTQTYAVPKDEPLSEKTYHLCAWLAFDATDLRESTRWNILSYLLCGNDGSPLRKAVTDSHLGSNVIFDGATTIGMEGIFSVGIDGSEKERYSAFYKVVQSTLERLAHDGFSDDEIKAAFQKSYYPCVEYTKLQAFTIATKVSSACSAGISPTALLDAAHFFEELQEELKTDKTLFQRLIQEKLLQNPHRLGYSLTPDPTKEETTAARHKARLNAIRAQKSDAEMEEIAKDAEHLARINGTPNTPEQLRTLPTLNLSDIPRTLRKDAFVCDTLQNGRPFLVTNMPTQDVVYLSCHFNINDLPEEYRNFANMLASSITEFGTLGYDFAKAELRRSLVCGSIGATYSEATDKDGNLNTSFTYTLKTTTSTLNEALDRLEEIIFHFDPCDKNRMSDLLIQLKTSLKVILLQEARSTTQTYSTRNFSLRHMHKYQFSTTPLLNLLEGYTSSIDTAYDELTQKWQHIRNIIHNPSKIIVTLTGPDSANAIVKDRINVWCNQLKSEPIIAQPFQFTPSFDPHNEGLSASLQVAFSAMSMPGPAFLDEDAMALNVAISHLSEEYFLPELRFKGNAYGGGAFAKNNDHTISFFSFRDPHIAETYQIYQNSLNAAKSLPFEKEAIEDSIIAASKQVVEPLRPAMMNGLAYSSYILKQDLACRTKRFESLLSVTPKSAKEALIKHLEAGLPHATFVVAASETMLKEAQTKIPNLTIEKLIKND